MQGYELSRGLCEALQVPLVNHIILNSSALFPLNQQSDSQEIYGPSFVLLVHARMHKLKFLCTEKMGKLWYSI